MKPDDLNAARVAAPGRERPILFTTEMVEAIAAGLKTETRRGASKRKRYGAVGDRLWVKETYYAWGRWERRASVKKDGVEWHFVDTTFATNRMYLYVACARSQSLPVCSRRAEGVLGWWLRPAFFMPRAASRWLLDIRDLDVERLSAITEEGARNEGYPAETGGARFKEGPIQWYRRLWDSINAKSGLAWETDPLVVVVRFVPAIERLEQLQVRQVNPNPPMERRRSSRHSARRSGAQRSSNAT